MEALNIPPKNLNLSPTHALQQEYLIYVLFCDLTGVLWHLAHGKIA